MRTQRCTPTHHQGCCDLYFFTSSPRPLCRPTTSLVCTLYRIGMTVETPHTRIPCIHTGGPHYARACVPACPPRSHSAGSRPSSCHSTRHGRGKFLALVDRLLVLVDFSCPRQSRARRLTDPTLVPHTRARASHTCPSIHMAGARHLGCSPCGHQSRARHACDCDTCSPCGRR